jgi:hypothetical protein
MMVTKTGVNISNYLIKKNQPNYVRQALNFMQKRVEMG